MDEKRVLFLLNDLWDDLHGMQGIWQFLVLAACLALAHGLTRGWYRHFVPAPNADNAAQPVTGRPFNEAFGRLVFPLSALLLVLFCRMLLRGSIRVNLLNVAVPLLTALALVRGILHALRYAFPGASWLQVWERVLATLVWGGLALIITDLDHLVIAGLESVDFVLGKQRLNLWLLLNGLLAVALTILSSFWVANLLEQRLLAATGLDSSLRIVLTRVLKAGLGLVAVLASLSLVGIDITTLSVFTGALGVGLGFGLQKIASNYVAGFIILLDRSIRLGNVIRVNPETMGTVSQITTRYTVLRHVSGSEFIIPNETFIGGIVENHALTDSRLRLSVKVGVAYDSDLEQVVPLMENSAREHRRVLAEPPPQVMLHAFGDNALELELVFWIADPEGGTANVCSDISFALWRRFRQYGIVIPFPQREVRLLQETNPSVFQGIRHVQPHASAFPADPAQPSG